jgi:hypothetical protein
MYNRAFISADCSMIILIVFILSTHERPGRNTACSFLIPFSRTSIILVKMILQNTLLATQRRLMPFQFLQFDRSPFLGIFTITPLFHSSGVVSDVQMSVKRGSLRCWVRPDPQWWGLVVIRIFCWFAGLIQNFFKMLSLSS